MEEKRISGVWIVALVMAALIPLLYVSGYYLGGESRSFGGRATVRCYRVRWMAVMYKPAAELETKVTGNRFFVAWNNGEQIHILS